MKKLLLIAGVAMFSATAPAAADPGKGQGTSKHATIKHGKSQVNAKYATMNHGKAHKAGKGSRGIVTSDRFGRLYAFDARGSCPPGLAKRDNGCQPPGQAKKTFDVGQRYNRNFGDTWTYDQIPPYLQSQYSFDRADRYYYNNGYLYQVDPKTMLVQQVISALLR
jgi:hypothetical protein